MKEGNKLANISAIMLSLVSLIEAVVVAIFSSYEWYFVVLAEVCFIGGVCLVRFAYQIASLRNIWHSVVYRRNQEGDDEPSEFAVKATKFSGYLLMFLTTILFLSAAILY